MEITAHRRGEMIELRLNGRIDATWAEHVGATIENAIRVGEHRILLNFAEVKYISSLGIRVLLVQYKLLKSVKGTLAISNPSDFCRDVLNTVGFSDIIVEDEAVLDAPPTVVAAVVATPAVKERRGAADYEIYAQPVTRPLTCRLIGDPTRLSSNGFAEDNCQKLMFADGTYGLGLGAFGQDYADCIDRFGEFLAAGGCAISLPTNESGARPDYVVEEGNLVPQVEALFAITGEGDFSTMVRFDAASESHGIIALSELVESLLDISGANDISSAESIGFVVMAETAGVVGATLRQSPAGRPLTMGLPDVREWLSFTTERASEKTLCLLVGVASRAAGRDTQPFFRPIKPGSATLAHIHAAVFPYRPVQRGELPFARTVNELLAASSPNTVLHLMADTRPFEGVGETDLIRGACWFSPLPTIERMHS